LSSERTPPSKAKVPRVVDNLTSWPAMKASLESFSVAVMVDESPVESDSGLAVIESVTPLKATLTFFLIIPYRTVTVAIPFCFSLTSFGQI